MTDRKVFLGPAARAGAAQNSERVRKKAEALAASLTLPDDVEFARFEHGGRIYALSVRLLVEVDLLTSRVPDVVIRRSDRRVARRR
jgi:hypothetical protein